MSRGHRLAIGSRWHPVYSTGKCHFRARDIAHDPRGTFVALGDRSCRPSMYTRPSERNSIVSVCFPWSIWRPDCYQLPGQFACGAVPRLGCEALAVPLAGRVALGWQLSHCPALVWRQYLEAVDHSAPAAACSAVTAVCRPARQPGCQGRLHVLLGRPRWRHDWSPPVQAS
jgi:hypothetical protein